MNKSLVGIVGGTGFVSGHRAAHLSNRGVRTRILTAHPEGHRDIKVLPGLKLTNGHIFDPRALARNPEGCAAP
jgi:NADH dehydrogenase